jgi:hypothetical protein
MRALFVLLTLCLACLECSAQGEAYPTGLDLVKRCNALNGRENHSEQPDAETVEDYGYCLGFVVGYVSGFAARDAVGEQGMFCPPANATIADFVDAIQQWLVQHPEGLEQPGVYVAAEAFRSRFKCETR